MNELNQGAIGVLTSGGDAQGMNAAIRAVVRSAIAAGFEVFGVYEGYQGLVDDRIEAMGWESVSGVMEFGGTFLGTARSMEFKTHAGLLKAVANLLKHRIDKLVVIGGDGSLAGADELRAKWPELVRELVQDNRAPAGAIEAFPQLKIVGMVGSIDNDMAETEMTIGADTALHRICEAVDALSSTAFSHQRTFIVEVMGRNCGYLALMSAIAAGASIVFIPEAPPVENWERSICTLLEASRKAGRHDHIIIVAEGARDRSGKLITSAYIQEVLDKRLHIESRITILGHVQRGGAPSAFDRYMSTAFGCVAVESFTKDTSNESRLVALRGNRVCTVPLMDAVAKTRATAAAIAAGEYARADELRGSDWCKMGDIYRTLALAVPSLREPGSVRRRLRIGMITSGWPAPGMNSARRTISRLSQEAGHQVIGIVDGADGLIQNRTREFSWMEVENWNSKGGSKLGANRHLPGDRDFYAVARTLEQLKLDGLVMVGGWSGYLLTDLLNERRKEFPSFRLPIVCVPASINNNLPGAELAIGPDTALNTIVEAIDKIKHSADSARRVFIVEVMGRYCGYLAMMSGLACGGEYVYLHEDGLKLARLQHDIEELKRQFSSAERHMALIIRNELVNPTYTTDFIEQLFSEESDGWFDVRKTILGPMQQGGTPSPFDRIQGVRLGHLGLTALIDRIARDSSCCAFVGQSEGKLRVFDWHELRAMVSSRLQRPQEQWWLGLKQMAEMLNRRPVAAGEKA